MDLTEKQYDNWGLFKYLGLTYASEFPHSSLVFNSGFSSLMSIASVTFLSH